MADELDDVETSAAVAAEPFRFVEVRMEAGIARLGLASPPANMLSLEVLRELGRALDSVEFDSTVKLLVLRGGDAYFSAGFEIGDHLGERAYPILDAFRRVVQSLSRLDKLSLCVVSGAAHGAGAALAAACDVVYAGAGARFSFPEIRAGLFNPAAVALLPRLVGARRALELIVTGGSLTAAQAEQCGLVTRAVPEESLAAEVDAFVKRVGDLSAPAVQLTRRAWREAQEVALAEAIGRAEDVYLNQLLNTEDATEGVAAVAARRRPVWKNR